MKKMLAILVAVSAIFLFTGTSFAFLDNNEASADAAAGAEAGFTLNDSFNSTSRPGFPIPGEVNYGPLVNYYGQSFKSDAYQDLKEILMYKETWTKDELLAIANDVEDAEVEFKGIANDANSGVTEIRIVMQDTKIDNTTYVGHATARSDDRRTTMIELMAVSALEAMDNGCNLMHLKNQGAVRDTKVFGWGIGFNTTAATLNTAGDVGTISSGGFGVSSAEAGQRDKPWFQAFGLVE